MEVIQLFNYFYPSMEVIQLFYSFCPFHVGYPTVLFFVSFFGSYQTVLFFYPFFGSYPTALFFLSLSWMLSNCSILFILSLEVIQLFYFFPAMEVILLFYYFYPTVSSRPAPGSDVPLPPPGLLPDGGGGALEFPAFIPAGWHILSPVRHSEG